MFVCLRMYVCMRLYVCISVRLFVCMYVRTYVCMSVKLYVCECVSVLASVYMFLSMYKSHTQPPTQVPLKGWGQPSHAATHRLDSRRVCRLGDGGEGWSVGNSQIHNHIHLCTCVCV